MKVTLEYDVHDCRDCPYAKPYPGGPECFTACEHPDRQSQYYESILWGCREQFSQVPKWCPLGLGAQA